MAVGSAVSCSVLYFLLDVAVTTVLYTQGSHLDIFKKDVLNFTISHSVLDLWGTLLVRASLLLGASIGVSWNREDGPLRVARLTTLVIFICLLIITYTLAKLLMLTEVGPLTQQPWFLSLICWTCVSSLAFLLPWTLLGKVSKSVGGHSPSGVEGGSEDTEKLVETAGEEEQEVGCERKNSSKEGGQETQPPSSGATLGRLLSYCRKDGGLLSVAVLFLIIAAVCECCLSKTKQAGEIHLLCFRGLQPLSHIRHQSLYSRCV